MAERVAPWLRRLKSEDVISIRPLLTPCGFQSHSDPNAQWGMITDGDRGIELWQPAWKARVIGRFDETPFSVIFTAKRYSRWSAMNSRPVSDTWDDLGECLNAVQQKLESSMDWTAKQSLRACYEAHLERKTTIQGMQDLIPASVDRPVAALAASAARAFVFMESHSWDELFAQRPGLRELFEGLWRVTMSAFETAASAASLTARQAA